MPRCSVGPRHQGCGARPACRCCCSPSAGGSPDEPQWFKNLRSAEHATVELGDRQLEVDVRIVPEAERQALWARFLAEGTTFASYERKTDRPFAIAVLTPR